MGDEDENGTAVATENQETEGEEQPQWSAEATDNQETEGEEQPQWSCEVGPRQSQRSSNEQERENQQTADRDVCQTITVNRRERSLASRQPEELEVNYTGTWVPTGRPEDLSKPRWMFHINQCGSFIEGWLVPIFNAYQNRNQNRRDKLKVALRLSGKCRQNGSCNLSSFRKFTLQRGASGSINDDEPHETGQGTLLIEDQGTTEDEERYYVLRLTYEDNALRPFTGTNRLDNIILARPRINEFPTLSSFTLSQFGETETREMVTLLEWFPLPKDYLEFLQLRLTSQLDEYGNTSRECLDQYLVEVLKTMQKNPRYEGFWHPKLRDLDDFVGKVFYGCTSNQGPNSTPRFTDSNSDWKTNFPGWHWQDAPLLKQYARSLLEHGCLEFNIKAKNGSWGYNIRGQGTGPIKNRAEWLEFIVNQGQNPPGRGLPNVERFLGISRATPNQPSDEDENGNPVESDNQETEGEEQPQWAHAPYKYEISGRLDLRQISLPGVALFGAKGPGTIKKFRRNEEGMWVQEGSDVSGMFDLNGVTLGIGVALIDVPGLFYTLEGSKESYADWSLNELNGDVKIWNGGGNVIQASVSDTVLFLKSSGPRSDRLEIPIKINTFPQNFNAALSVEHQTGTFDAAPIQGLTCRPPTPRPVTDLPAVVFSPSTHFRLGSALLASDGKQDLGRFCAQELALFNHPSSSLEIFAHTDTVDCQSRNVQLSALRGLNVLFAIHDILGDSMKIPCHPIPQDPRNASDPNFEYDTEQGTGPDMRMWAPRCPPANQSQANAVWIYPLGETQARDEGAPQQCALNEYRRVDLVLNGMLKLELRVRSSSLSPP